MIQSVFGIVIIRDSEDFGAPRGGQLSENEAEMGTGVEQEDRVAGDEASLVMKSREGADEVRKGGHDGNG